MDRHYLVNKPFQAAGMSADNVRGWEIVRKMNIGREAKLRGQMWDFEDNLSAKDIIGRHTSKPEKGFIYFITLPLIFHSQNFKTARKHGKKASGDLMANARD